MLQWICVCGPVIIPKGFESEHDHSDFESVGMLGVFKVFVRAVHLAVVILSLYLWWFAWFIVNIVLVRRDCFLR